MVAKNVKLNFKSMLEYRRLTGMNQSEFWQRFGVTQSGGSRYETGRNIPKPIQLLLALSEMGVLNEDTLEKARKVIAKAS